ncbi:pectin lyase fold/virulence factor [Xylariales sp. PMI_506]|nr:pectin lyase fold/virulence factor [Xylariales sp. PMI_506]
MRFLNPLSVITALAGVLGFVSALPSSEIVKRTARESPPSGCLSVRGSGTQSGEYSTLTAALASLSGTGSACIFIYSGTYSEDELYINYGGKLTLYGYTTNTGYQEYNTVTFQRSMNSATAGNLDGSSVANIVSAGFKAYNINFKNTYGSGAQAVAVTANADEMGFYACGFYSYQDTLYAKSGRQYYSNCYIQGAVDYIFGGAAAWFGECNIRSVGGGAITASSRDSTTDTTWYVIDSSNIDAASGYSLASEVWLGRNWRQYSRVIYQNSYLSNIIIPAGWTTLWSPANPIFEEYNNNGAGSSTSARVLETVATTGVSKDTLWGSGWKDWVDTSY